MECQELLGLLARFQTRALVVRGRRVNQGLIFLSLDSDGCGRLEAALEMPGHGTEGAIRGALIGSQKGIPDQAFVEFADLADLEAILRGQKTPEWRFLDE